MKLKQEVLKQDVRGWDYLKLALLAFAGLGLELVVVSVEPFLYGRPVDFEDWTVLAHWALTCTAWAGVIALLLNYARKKYGFHLNGDGTKRKLWQWAAVASLMLLSIYLSYQSWGGFKVQKEFLSLGAVKFLFQYLYYFFETGLFTLIIVFGQKAFEKWFKSDKVPYGGIICAATWGISHMFTKSSVEVGILSAVVGFGFGAVYLLLNRDLRKTFPILFFMFVL